MSDRPFSSVAEQVAQLLREGLQEGRWQGVMPGRLRLAEELQVNHKTAKAALRILEEEGLLLAQGAGRQRKIVQEFPLQPARLRVRLLPYEKGDLRTDYLVNLIGQLQAAGHVASFASKSMCELGMNVSRVARWVRKTDADAWVVVAGSREILEWFAEQELPVFALFGRASRVPIASTAPDKDAALRELVDRLFELGHRRIVMLARQERRQPFPGHQERMFLEQLESYGIRTGNYNLPDWGDRPEDLERVFRSLFRLTPPTALIIDDPMVFPSVFQHLGRLGIAVPDDVSLACTDSSVAFDWFRPTVAHIRWPRRPTINRVVRWAENVSHGRDDRRKSTPLARFVPGGTIGPAPAG